MKKYINGILFTSLLLLASCFADKGNYDYDPEFLKVEGIQLSYKVNLNETLTISPKVSPESDDYEYTWGIYKQLVVAQGTPKLDTISTEKDLNWTCSDIKASNYPLIFTVRNKKTNVSKTIYAPLSIVTKNTIGWYVLKDFARDGERYTDMDIFGEDGKVENILAMHNDGKQLKGSGVNISYSDLYKDEGDYMNVMLVSSTKDLAIIYINEGKIIRGMESNNIFYDIPPVINVQKTFGGKTRLYLFNDGKVHQMDIGDKFIVPHVNKFGEKEFTLSKKFIYDSYKKAGLFFDEDSKSFIRLTDGGFQQYKIDEVGPFSYSPNNMNKNLTMLLSMPLKEDGAGAGVGIMNYFEENGEGVLEEKRIVFVGGATLDNTTNPINMALPIPKSVKLVDKADYWAGNMTDGTVMFHYEGKIYSFDFSGRTMTETEVLALKSDEKFSYMEEIIFTPGKGDEEAKYIDRFVIATEVSDGTYRVYRYKMEYGRLTLDGDVFTGVGRAVKVMYASQWGSNNQ